MGRRKGPPRVRLGSTVLKSTKARLEAEAHRRGVAVGVVIEELALALPAPSWDAALGVRHVSATTTEAGHVYPTCEGSGKVVFGYEAGTTRAPCPWCRRWVWIAQGVDRATIEKHDLSPPQDSPPSKERRVRVKESKK